VIGNSDPTSVISSRNASTSPGPFIRVLLGRPDRKVFVRQNCELLSMFRSSFPRRQQYRRLRRAAASAGTGVTAGALAVIAASASAIPVAGALLLIMLGLLIDARRWARLAARSRIGAHSEDEVRRALAPLEAQGWQLRHSLPYKVRGDIDSVAIAPTGITFTIETKTRTFDARHLAVVREMAAWLCRRRRRWSRRGMLPVLCVVRARGLERIEDGVLIVSIDRLVAALRTAAGTSQRPAFLVASSLT
jgi:Nuclease-related domain